MHIPDRAEGDALALKHFHHPETGNTFGWPGRTVIGTSPYERHVIRLWADGIGLDHCYVRRTRPYWLDDEEFGTYRDTCLIVMIERPNDYHEFVDLLDAVPRRSRRLGYEGKLSSEAAAALREANFRIMLGSRRMALSIEDGVAWPLDCG